MSITLEPHGIFEYYLAYLYILTLSSHWPGMQNGDEASPSISPADSGILVKILITHEPHNIF